MALFTFRGGVHLSEEKDASKDKKVKKVLPKGDLVFPLSQHLGAPAVPLVKKGDAVLAGQKIAEANGMISCPIHSSVSGTVKAIEPRMTISGAEVESIIIENDHKYEDIGFQGRDPEQMTREEILECIKEAGIVGMGGAGFPANVKLSPKEPDKIDYLLINCAECEPYLTSDYRIMVEEPESIVEGLRIVLKLFPGAKGILAVEDNKMDCANILRKLIKGDDRISVKILKTKYPQGAERQLIYAATKRAINSSQLPADAGCIVHNVETVAAIYRAITKGIPLMHRVITITGDAVSDPRNFSVLTGTNYRELVNLAGGLKAKPKKMISGGPMMGVCMITLDIPVIKTSSALICLSKDEVAELDPIACINCGRCVADCPERLLPSRLADCALRGDREGFLKLEGMECCECGCCSFICPSKRRMTQSIKTIRRSILADRRKR